MGRATSKTIRFLAQSNNRAATELLFAAVHSSHQPVRYEACRHIIGASASARALILNIRGYDDTVLDTLNELSSRLVPALQLELLSHNAEHRRAAYHAIHALRITEMIPALVSLALQGDAEATQTLQVSRTYGKKTSDFAVHDDSQTLAQNKPLETLFFLIDTLNEQHHSEDPQIRANVATLVRRTGDILLRSFRQTSSATMTLWMRIFFLMFPYFSAVEHAICEVLTNASHPLYTTIYRSLLSSAADVVVPFVTERLDQPSRFPRTLAGVLSKRNDVRFVSAIGEFLAEHSQNHTIRTNLESITTVAWIPSIATLLKMTSFTQHIGMAHFFACVSIPTDERMTALLSIVENSGSPLARAVAIEAIPLDAPVSVNATIVIALEDPNPDVQIAAIRQVAQRHFPDALSTILTFADSPDQRVRHTVAEFLPDLRLTRFLEVYDTLDERRRETFFKMVSQIDPNVVPQLEAFLTTGNALMQERALRCVRYGNLASKVESSIGQVALEGKSESNRLEAIRLLALGGRNVTRHMLVQILHRDTSEAIRQAAQEALERRPVARQTSSNETQDAFVASPTPETISP